MTTTQQKPLSAKQAQVLDALRAGSTPNEVANKLRISVNGVYGHMRRIEANGYDVPRSGRGAKPKRKARRARKTALNGTGPTSEVESTIAEGIDKLVAFATERRKEIEAEVGGKLDARENLDAEIQALQEEDALLSNRLEGLARAQG